jgi:hypothetical protein
MSESNLDHLHPAVRDIAGANDEVRLQAIRSKRWITHEPAAQVLAIGRVPSGGVGGR